MDARAGGERRSTEERAPVRSRGRRRPVVRAVEAVHEFGRRVYEKAAEDNIFFMAGAIAFNIIVAFVPLVLAVLGIAGALLRFQEGAAVADPLRDYILSSVPPVFYDEVRGWIQELVEQSTGLLSIGTLVLVWLATRLVGTLRTALREVFDVQQEDRGIVRGKIFDTRMVFTAGTLFAVNIGLTIGIELIARYGVEFLGIQPGQLPGGNVVYAQVLAFATIWFMFLLIYRYLPPRRTAWSTSVIAATFTGVLFEAMKLGFSWYIANVANYQEAYGATLTTVIVLFLWIYYSAVVFVLGGEVAQVGAMWRIRRQQKERLR